MKKVIFVLTILTCFSFSARYPAEKIRRVVIDAGHGGKDPGCLGSNVYEKDIAFDIAMELGHLIKQFQPEVEVIYTRHRKDQFVELKDRAQIANRAQADLFISIHCNASYSKESQGTETYVMGVDNRSDMRVAMRENSVILREQNYLEKYNGFDPTSPITYILLANYKNSNQDKSLLMAQKVEEHFHLEPTRKSRGVKQDQFYVLARTNMPSILVEVGFLTNKEEEAYLMKEEGRLTTAAALYRAFRDYKQQIEGIKLTP